MNRRRLAALLLLIVAADFAHMAWRTPPLVLVAAMLPALLFTGLALALERGRSEAISMLLATFLWGAIVAAFLSSSASDLVHAWIATSAGDERARLWAPGLAAPVIEEMAKGGVLLLVLRLRRDRSTSVRDGIVYGALVGVGFAMTENCQYFLFAVLQGGARGLGHAMYVRAVLGGLDHALFTATVGAGLGWAHGGWLAPTLGLAAAVAEHVAWNTVASPAITEVLCGASSPGASCRTSPEPWSMLVGAPLIALAFLVPGWLALALVLRRASGRVDRPPAGSQARS